MKNISLALALLFLTASAAKAADPSVLELFGIRQTTASSDVRAPQLSKDLPARAASLPVKYAHLDPERMVPADLLETAVAYYDANFKRIRNHNYLSVVDFSKFAGQKRFFLINMQTGEVKALLVSHGEGSDPTNTGYATLFSNNPRSKQSSLGFYLTGGTYYGKFKLAMRLTGLSRGNSRASSRAIVVHGYTPVTERYAGPSWGCLAVAPAEMADVAKKIKNGSIIYAGVSGDAGAY